MSDKWQFYSQTGVDGPEYGIRIRPGYVVVGFQKEDAQAIVTWQNASIQPEGDILERAKAVRNSAFGTHKQALDMVDELIDEVERKQRLIAVGEHKNARMEEQIEALVIRCKKAETEVKRLRSQSVEQVFRRKNDKIAQDAITIQMHHENVLALQKEVERLRSERGVWIKHYNDVLEANARIEELEADNKRLEAAFLEARHDWACSKFDDIRTRDECDQHAREALERIKEGQKG